MGGGLESRCVGRVYGADGAVRSESSNSLRLTMEVQSFKFLIPLHTRLCFPCG